MVLCPLWCSHQLRDIPSCKCWRIAPRITNGQTERSRAKVTHMEIEEQVSNGVSIEILPPGAPRVQSLGLLICKFDRSGCSLGAKPPGKTPMPHAEVTLPHV